MKIDLNGNTIEVVFDTAGNVYFMHQDKLFDLVIDGKNKLSSDEIKDFDQQEIKVNKGLLKGINKEKTLKHQIIMKNDLQNMIQHDMNVHNVLYYEDDSLQEEIDMGDNDDEEEKVYFSDNSSETKIINHDTEVAMYDTILYNNNSPVFKTTLSNIIPSCRLIIKSCGTISFRVIGESEHYYKISDLLNISVPTLIV